MKEIFKFCLFLFFFVSYGWGEILHYTVKSGDSLYKISKKIYNKNKWWKRIYKANLNKIKNPDLIFPGQVLIIPGKETEVTNNIKETKQEKITTVKSVISNINALPYINNYKEERIMFKNKFEQFNERVPDFLSPEIFTNIDNITEIDLKNKTNYQDVIYITIFDFNEIEKKNKFWEELKSNISTNLIRSNELMISEETNLSYINFKYETNNFTIFKKKGISFITFLKTEIKYFDDVKFFVDLFSKPVKEKILNKGEIEESVFILPDNLPEGFKLLEFKIEEVKTNYFSEKYRTKWALKIVGKLNISLLYKDNENSYWAFSIFKMDNEPMAEEVYDVLYSKPKEKILTKIQNGNFSRQLENYGKLESLEIGKKKCWFVENKLKNVSEINFRLNKYIVTISVDKIGEKDKLLKIANYFFDKKSE